MQGNCLELNKRLVLNELRQFDARQSLPAFSLKCLQQYSQLQKKEVLFLSFKGINQLEDVVMFYPLKEGKRMKRNGGGGG